MDLGFSQSYYIDGFRSLIDFKIDIRSGLNVICGPNGSGKTNFIDFLDFIGSVAVSGASNAISRSGGLARVFSGENIRKKSPTIRFSATGIANLNKRRRFSREIFPLSFFKFEYSIEIKFNKNASATYISSEYIRFHRCSYSSYSAKEAPFIGAVALTRTGPPKQFGLHLNISPRLNQEANSNPLRPVSPTRRPRSMEDITDMLRSLEAEPDESMLSRASALPAFDAVRFAITRGRSFNILPDRARSPNDVTQPLFIDRDGFGLSSTLFYLRAASEGGKVGHMRYFLEDIPPDSFEMIKQWTRIIFPELADIYVNKDMHTGKFLVSVLVGSERQVRVSLQGLSDGTVKWLALICLLVLSSGPSSLEEPENFLHPKVQSFLVEIIRDNVNDDENIDYFILSSHSETIINSCRPDELIIFNFIDNRTVCSRISDPERVLSEINKTGFGLGYYYASGSIS